MMPILSVLRPDIVCTRKRLNQFTYKQWRNPKKPIVIEGLKIIYHGQPEGVGTQHHWRIDAGNASERLRKIFEQSQRGGRLPVVVSPPRDNQGQNATHEWNGLFFRSPAEMEIAKELDSRGILFFPNIRGRVPSRDNRQDSIEVDFLIFYNRQPGLLEVDGAIYHPSAANDHKRDRLFQRQGILCSRFAATECMANPAAVVDEFLELFGALAQAWRSGIEIPRALQ